MYKHIELAAQGALPIGFLEDLGSIVVICGKNNSGKTTLLQAIRNGRQYLKPDVWDKEVLRSFVENADGTQWSNAPDIVDPLPYIRDRWVETDIDIFVQHMYNALQNWTFYGSEPTVDQIKATSYYKQQLKSHNSVIVPPKRVLELTDSIQTSKSVSPNGEGLLNFLFRAQNQFEDSNERKLFDETQHLFCSVSGGYEFKITAGTDNDLKLSFRHNINQWIDAEACGLGLQDLLVLLFFVVNPYYDILLVEEPESHLHPEMQRKLLHLCKEKKEKQFFFSTHSSVFLDLTLVDTILHTEMTSEGIKIGNDTSRAVVLDSLGYSVTDNLVSDLIILVEGPSDKPVLEEFLRQLGLYTSYSIKIWPLGGDIMDQCDLSVFAEEYKILALIDKDPGSSRVRTRFKKKCIELGIDVTQLKKRAIENYFSINALKCVFKGQFPEHVTMINDDQTLKDQIGIDVKHNNHKIAKAMTLEEIKHTDLYSFLEKVKQVLQSCR